MTTLSWVLLILLVLAVVYLLARSQGARNAAMSASAGAVAPVPQAKIEGGETHAAHKRHSGCC